MQDFLSLQECVLMHNLSLMEFETFFDAIPLKLSLVDAVDVDESNRRLMACSQRCLEVPEQ